VWSFGCGDRTSSHTIHLATRMAGLQLPAAPPFFASLGDPPLPRPPWIAAFQTYLEATGQDGTDVTDTRKQAILIH